MAEFMSLIVIKGKFKAYGLPVLGFKDEGPVEP